MIGIRLADRSVFQVFADERPGKRRVILSTSHEGQDRVEIPVVHSPAGSDTGSLPITVGTVRLDDISGIPRSEQEIELVLHLRGNGTLAVAATDRHSGNVESISINLSQATAEATYSVPESLTSLREAPPASRRRLWPAILILLILLTLFGGALWLAFGGADRSARSGAPAGGAPVDSGSDEIVAPPSEAPSSEAPVTATEDEPPPGGVESAPRETESVAESGVGTTDEAGPSPTSTPPVGPIEYRIRRGDTLWDLANSFYGNPWLYPTLAETNRILNPDLIYAEDKITVPGDPEPSR